MEARNSYFDLDDIGYDDAILMPIDEHVDAINDIKHFMNQLVAELYDDCSSVDPDVVHHLILDLCQRLEIENPNIDTLKIK